METLHIVIDTLLWSYFVLTMGVGLLSYRQWKKRQPKSDNIDRMFQQWGGRDNS